MSEIHDIVAVEVTDSHRLRATFDDGAVREVDLSERPPGPVFDALADPHEFARVRVDAETGTVTWPSGADLDPIGVYECRGPVAVRRISDPSVA